MENLQLLVQFPLSFEYTEEFLILLFEHSYASEFGSFLGDNEMVSIGILAKN